MTRRGPINDQYFDAFADLYRFGLSARQVGVVMSAVSGVGEIKENVVLRLFKRTGIARRAPNGKGIGRRRAVLIRHLRRFHAKRFTRRKLARMFGVSKSSIQKIVLWKSYKHHHTDAHP